MLFDETDQKFEEAIKCVKLTAIPSTVRRQLAMHLDCYFGDADWKSLAEKCGLSSLEIQWFEYCARHTTHNSCTLYLFEHWLVTLGWSIEQLVEKFLAINNKACITVLRRAFEDNKLSSAVENKENEQSISCLVSDVNNCSVQAARSQKQVFITYSEDAEEVAHKAHRGLSKKGCVVYLDIYEEQLMFEDRLGWYDAKFKEANYILMLISPQHAININGKGMSDKARTARYINTRMRAEYFNNGCINKRFIPVILPGAVEDHMPEWLQGNTLSYYWPNHYDQIIARIRGRPRSRIPPNQNIPVVVISRS